MGNQEKMIKTGLNFTYPLLIMTICFVDKYEEGPYVSPTKNYTLLAKVDDMDEESENYGLFTRF